MNRLKMKRLIVCILLMYVYLPTDANAQKKSTAKKQKTWTYTYLKAKANQKQNLKEFLIKNWFVMDSIAVSKGLFNDYKLLENTNNQPSTEWDFIVAVEYFTAGTYSDIQEDWLEIKKNHKTRLINGKSMQDLGVFVKSEVLTDSYKKTAKTCTGNHIKLIQPFIGQWHEYLVTDSGEQLYGKLSIKISPETCSLKKEFQHLQQPFTYTTLGYFDTALKKWIETYSFSNGGYSIYEWNKDGNDFVLSVTHSAFKQQGLSRNRWKIINDNFFQIIVERSKDNGKTWQLSSTTNMKRINE